MANSLKLFIFIGALTITILSGCVSGASAKLLESHDHAALVRWYEQEATHLRERAEDMRAMVGKVRDYDSKGFYVDVLTLMKHCGDLADNYSKTADKAEELAQIHRSHQAIQ